MAKKYERKDLDKQNWQSNFDIIGKVRITDNTFSLDNKSEKSDWLWSRMNLYVDCGEKYGSIFCQLMGGYGMNRNNIIYVHGKKEDGSDDFQNSYTIDFEDRFNESIINDLGGLCFKNVGIELDTKNKLVRKRFLNDYDMIAYLSETLENDTVVHISGKLNYRIYNGNITVEKEIRSIMLSNVDADKFRAEFKQTILVDRDTVGDIDKERNTLMLNAYVVEKFKEFNGHDLTENGETNGKYVPMLKEFEFDLEQFNNNNDHIKKAVSKLFKPKKGVTQITCCGYFVEGGATVSITEEDIPDDVKELIDLGLMTMEEVETKCAGSGSREYRMIIKKPDIKVIKSKDGSRDEIQTQIFEEKYVDEDLNMECLVPITQDEDEEDTAPFNESDDELDEDWLSKL